MKVQVLLDSKGSRGERTKTKPRDGRSDASGNPQSSRRDRTCVRAGRKRKNHNQELGNHKKLQAHKQD